MKLYIEAKVAYMPVGYAEVTISSAYNEPFDCIDNSLVEEGSNIIIVTDNNRFVQGKVIDKAKHKLDIYQEGNAELLEKIFKIIK